jgi:hypothetical protein
MITIDDALTRAGAGLRDASWRVPDRPWDPPGTSPNRRTVAALTGVAVVVAAFGIPALWLGTGDGMPLAGTTQPLDQPTPIPPATDAGETARMSAASSDFPYLAIVYPGWAPIEAFESELAGLGHVYVVYEEQSEDGSGGIATLELKTVGKKSRFDDMLVSLDYEKELIIVREKQATLFVFEQDMLFGIHWLETAEVEASLLAESVTREEFLALAEAVESIPSEAWEELRLQHWPGTTTTIAPTTTSSAVDQS